MELSIIIVNYNVRHFLEQCLCSVQEALKGSSGEVIVIDNNSTDHSLEYLEPAFPSVRFIANKTNPGFAKACNQGYLLSKGRFVVFLNPDTILPEDCFRSCIAFFSSKPGAGAVGVRMIDGSGNFLKESKRAFPSPLTSFYKLSGLAKIFPRSKSFGRYHLGHLDEKEINEVDVLAGAFMMIKREVLEKTGAFDETFFMYGEDIDLSYRIQQAGYANYYFPGTTIIHFKGESTKKTSVNYVRMFYKAMSIFARKHYGGSRAGIFNSLIQVAIWTRAVFSAIGNFIKRAGLPLVDAGLILLSFWLAWLGWSEYVRPGTVYHHRLLWISFPSYTVFFLVTAWYAGLYDRWYTMGELARSTIIATVILLAAYGLMPEEWRFSRGIVLSGAFISFILLALLRLMLIRMNVLVKKGGSSGAMATVIASGENEYQEIIALLNSAGVNEKIMGRISSKGMDNNVIGDLSQLETVAKKLPFSNIIFCQGELSFKEIITSVSGLPRNLSARIHAKNSRSIVGSDSKDEAGLALAAGNGLKLSDPHNKRLKRLIDVSVAIMAIIFFPVHLLMVKKPFSFFGNAFEVITGKKTWIGYARPVKTLPQLREGVLACNGISPNRQQLPAESLQMMDYWYARDYNPATDLRLIGRMYRQLGG